MYVWFIYVCEMCINMHILYNLIMLEDTDSEFLYGFKSLITKVVINEKCLPDLKPLTRSSETLKILITHTQNLEDNILY